MTLQHKIIEKQNKKGFTLVELVVVIAILAILAAIAIPMVVYIVNDAADSADKTSASALNEACYNFYSLVKSGSINNQTKNFDGSAVSVAASPGAPWSVRDKSAKKATVEDALKYSGLNISTANSGGTLIYDGWCFYTKTANGHKMGEIADFSEGILPPDTTHLTPKTPFNSLYNE